MPFMIRFALYFEILFSCFFQAGNIFAQNPSSAQQIQVPLTKDGISTRLVPEQSDPIRFPRTVLSFGIYRELLSHQSGDLYSPSRLGVSLGLEQGIGNMWAGGLELRWSRWDPKQTQNDPPAVDKMSPLSLFSKIYFQPKLNSIIGDFWGAFFRPYVTGGFGYMSFFNDGSWVSVRPQTAFGQTAITYGGGVRLAVFPYCGLKMGYESWRGLETSDYAGQIFLLQLVFGDVIHL